MSRTDLEFIARRRLQELPTPVAPPTLLPRVMRRVQAWAARPWYARAWFTWPTGLQIASVATLALLFAGLVLAAPWAESLVRDRSTSLLSGAMTSVPDLTQRLDAMASAAQILWHALVHPVLVFAFVVVIAMAVLCATVAVALNRVVFGKTVHS